MTDYDILLDREDAVDITDNVDCYAHGKTWDCTCGGGMWGYHETKQKKCRKCKNINVDTKAEEREAPMTDDEQMTLGGFS